MLLASSIYISPAIVCTTGCLVEATPAASWLVRSSLDACHLLFQVDTTCSCYKGPDAVLQVLLARELDNYLDSLSLPIFTCLCLPFVR